MGGGALTVARPAAADAGCDSGGTCIEVHTYVNGTDTVIDRLTGSQLQADADVSPNGSTAYGVRSGHGPVSDDNVSKGLSIPKLLADSVPDPGSVTFTAVPRPNGTWSLLTAQDGELQKPNTTFENGLLPVVYFTGDGVGYIRPLLAGDPNDVNIDDVFTPTAQSDPLDVYVFTGPMLTVNASASPRSVKIGQPVSFSASVSGTSDSSGLQYSWAFGDGHTAGTLGPSHTFTAAGTYTVLLTVVGSGDDSGGMSQPLAIKVGNPTPTKTKTPSPGSGTHTPAPTTPSPGPVSTRTPEPGHQPSGGTGTGTGSGKRQGPGSGDGAHAKVPLFGTLHLRGSIATQLGARLSGQAPLIANGSGDQLAYVSGQLVGAGEPVSLSAAANESSIVSDSALSATADSASWSPGVVPIYVGAVLLLLGVGIARERGWLTLRRR